MKMKVNITKNEFQTRKDDPNRVFHWYEGNVGDYSFTAETDSNGINGINKGSIYNLYISKVEGGNIARYNNKWEYKSRNSKDGIIISEIIEYIDSISDKKDGEPKYKKDENMSKYAKGGSIDAPKIYVADLEAYNNGKLVGEWLDLSDFEDGKDVSKEISKLLKKWGAEEYAIHDVENVPSSIYSEYMGEEDFDKIIKIYKASEENDLPYEVISEIILQYEPENLEEWISDHYEGHFDNDTDLAYSVLENMGGVSDLSKKTAEMYFDYEGLGRDLEINGEWEGDFDSDEDRGYDYIENMGGVSELGDKTTEMYFDYDKFGRDLAINDYTEIEDGYYFRTPRYAKGGLTNERKYVNKSQDYETRYAKNRPSRMGYKDERKFAVGGELRSFNDRIFGKIIIFKEEQIGKFTIGIKSGFNNNRHVFIYEGKKGSYNSQGLPKNFKMTPQISIADANKIYSELKIKAKNNQNLEPFEIMKDKFAVGGEIGNQVTFSRYGERTTGRVTDKLRNGYEVVTDEGTILVEPQEVISFSDEPIAKKKRFGFFEGGGSIESKKQAILDFINSFPDKPKNWSEATDDLPELHHDIAEQYGSKYDFDFNKRSSLNERNLRHKQHAKSLLNKLSDEEISNVYSKWEETLEDKYAGGGSVESLLEQRKELLEELINSDIIDEEHGYYDDVRNAIKSNDSEQMREIIDELLSSGLIYKDDWDYRLARKLSKEGRKFEGGGEIENKIEKLKKVVSSKMLPEGVKAKAQAEIDKLEKQLHADSVLKKSESYHEEGKDVYGDSFYQWHNISFEGDEDIFAYSTPKGTVIYGEDSEGEKDFSTSFTTEPYYLEEAPEEDYSFNTLKESKAKAFELLRTKKLDKASKELHESKETKAEEKEEHKAGMDEEKDYVEAKTKALEKSLKDKTISETQRKRDEKELALFKGAEAKKPTTRKAPVKKAPVKKAVVKTKVDEIRDKVISFLNPLGYSATITDNKTEIYIEPSTKKVGKNRADFFDGMQIIYDVKTGGYEVSEQQAGKNEDELHIFKVTPSLALALKDLIKGNKRKAIKIWGGKDEEKDKAPSKPKADHKKLVAKLKAKKGGKEYSNRASLVPFTETRRKRNESSDRKREALPLGKRVSESGRTYYETRLNRGDISKEDKFEDGGEVKGSDWGLNLNW